MSIVPAIPAIDRLRLGFDSAMGEHGVTDATADDAESGRCFKRIGVFVSGERDNGKPFTNAADEKHGLLAAGTVFARHPGQRGPISGSPFVTGGSPQAVAITPSGRLLYVAGGSSNEVYGLRINATTGALTPVSGSPFPAGIDPFFGPISSSGQFAYVADANGNQISSFSIDASTGALTPLYGSPFAEDGSYPASIALVNPAVKACGALNVSAEATLTPGAYTRQSRTSDLWNETLTITNGVTPISGPLSVVLLALPSSTTTLSGTYTGLTTTYCFSTAGNYVVPIDSLIPPGNDDTLLPAEVLSVPFVFQATQDGSPVKPSAYKPLLISGTLNK